MKNFPIAFDYYYMNTINEFSILQTICSQPHTMDKQNNTQKNMYPTKIKNKKHQKIQLEYKEL